MDFELTEKEDRNTSRTSDLESVKCNNNYIYAKISINNSFKSELAESAVSFKNIILTGLSKLFGQMNKHVPVDILKYDSLRKEVIIRCDQIVFQRLCTSLVFNGCQRTPINIVKISYNNPLNLRFNSRSYDHCKKNPEY